MLTAEERAALLELADCDQGRKEWHLCSFDLDVAKPMKERGLMRGVGGSAGPKFLAITDEGRAVLVEDASTALMLVEGESEPSRARRALDWLRRMPAAMRTQLYSEPDKLLETFARIGATVDIAAHDAKSPGELLLRGAISAFPWAVGFLARTFRRADEKRLNDGVAAGAAARRVPPVEFALELVASSDEPSARTAMRETLRAMVDALDEAAVEPLGRLLAEYKGPPPLPPDDFLRGAARTLSDVSGRQLQTLRELLFFVTHEATLYPFEIAGFDVWHLADNLAVYPAQANYPRPSPVTGYRPGYEGVDEIAELLKVNRLASPQRRGSNQQGEFLCRVEVAKAARLHRLLEPGHRATT